MTPGAIGRGSGIEAIQRKLLDLSPQTDAQRWLQSTALQISGAIAAARWSVLQQISSDIQWPFMAILVFWLAIIFASFGLFAPRNASVTAALFRRVVGGRFNLSDPRNGPALQRGYQNLQRSAPGCFGAAWPTVVVAEIERADLRGERV